jgi:hypothetical protein
MMTPHLFGRSTLAVLLLVSVTAAQAQDKSYWLGTREGDQLKFTTKLPADAVKVVLKATPAPGRGDDTTPRYKKLVHTVDSRQIVVHMNEIAWTPNGHDSGYLTWRVDAGMGAEWMNLSKSDPLFAPFAQAIKGLSNQPASRWGFAQIVVVEGDRPEDSFRLNVDGSHGKPSPALLAQILLGDLTSKSDLAGDDMVKARQAFLVLANAARSNPNYRRENKAKTVLDLPSGLAPLVLDDTLTKAAQDQADYCASIRQNTHSQPDPAKATLGARLRALGYTTKAYEAAGSGSLPDCPRAWLVSSTHYRPWWNLDNEVVTKVGFGARKGSDGNWYFVAVLS